MDYHAESTYRPTRLPVEYASTLRPDAYRSAAYHDAERDALWTGSWVAIGFLDDVRGAGQTIVREVAGRSIIVTRGHDDRVRGFLNVCRHRGSQLLEADCTIRKRIRCPYHAWAYGLDGECLGTPLFEGSEIPEEQRGMFDMSETKEFNRSDYGLLPVRLDTWGMLLFVDVSGNAPPLLEWLGDLPARFAGYDLAAWEIRARNAYDIAANWKLIAENFMEYYHLPWVHPELMKVSRMEDHYRWQGPGMYTGMTTSPVTQDHNSGWLDLPPHDGLSGADRVSGRFVHIFPNVALSVLPNHAFVMLLDPRSPSRTIEMTTVLTHPQSVEAEGAAAALDKLGAFWDHVNREDIGIVERVQRGLSIPEYQGGRMCYHFEEPLHRFQNMVIDRMVGIERIPPGDTDEVTPVFG